MYFRRTCYGIPSLSFTTGNQGSIGYLFIQLFSSQLLGLCRDYGTTYVILLCGAVVFSYLGFTVHSDSAPGVLDRNTRPAQYTFKTYALHWRQLQ